MSIRLDAMPPHTMRCSDCGETWEPEPTRGKSYPTDSTLERNMRQHWATCRKSAVRSD